MEARPVRLNSFFGLWLFQALFALDLAFAAPSKERVDGLTRLYQSSLLRVNDCRQVLNELLPIYGLPQVGKDAPLRGVRKNMDRRRERRSPPVLIDSLVPFSGPYASVKVSASWDQRTRIWEVSIERMSRLSQAPLPGTQADGELISDEIRYRFSIGSRDNRSSCELEELIFIQDSESSKFKADDCLKLWLEAEQDPSESIASVDPEDAEDESLAVETKECGRVIGLFRTLKDEIEELLRTNSLKFKGSAQAKGAGKERKF